MEKFILYKFKHSKFIFLKALHQSYNENIIKLQAFIYLSAMPLQYRTHLQAIHDEWVYHGHPSFSQRLLYFLLSYAVVLAVSFTFYHKHVDSQSSYSVSSLPARHHQNPLYYVVIICLGLAGLFAAVGDYWSTHAWVLYFFANLFLALYVFIYQLGSRFALFIAMIVSVILAFNLEWLFIESGHIKDEAADLFIRNMIGVVGAWTLLFCLLTIGQFFVHSVGMDRKFQSICYFIAGIGMLLFIAIWNTSFYATWSETIGFVLMGTIILGCVAVHNHG